MRGRDERTRGPPRPPEPRHDGRDERGRDRERTR